MRNNGFTLIELLIVIAILVILAVIVVPAIVLLMGYYAGPNTCEDIAREARSVAGFWLGFVHGTYMGLMFIISLFSENVHFYEVYNNGAWYNFGFILGAGTFVGLLKLILGEVFEVITGI